jgi:YD repeat-containing protein
MQNPCSCPRKRLGLPGVAGGVPFRASGSAVRRGTAKVRQSVAKGITEKKIGAQSIYRANIEPNIASVVNYPGQTDPDTVLVNVEGTSTAPSVVARLLDNGTTQISRASYNANGLPTQTIDPAGRTTNYTYDPANGIDLLEVSQLDGTNQDILGTMTYNSQHLPLTLTDASGQVTTLTYNAQGQVLTSTDALNETTTLAYNSGSYLASVTGPVSGATTSFTYDSAGRVQTVTDSEGYVLTLAYDNLDRPVSVTYPNGNTSRTVYHNLDVAETIDRQGRPTYHTYDAIRELLSTTDPKGGTTKYTWCTCGGLSSLTDADNNVTRWGLDEEGRVTCKTYPDSSKINYVYENSLSRLHSMTDARGNVAVYNYNLDNTLAGTAYTPGSGVAATPNVSFTYDPVYNRVTSMTDGTGTTSYVYNPITGSVTTGAGRLASVSVPIAGTTASVTYAYDALGRVTNRGVDAATTNANNVSTTFDTLGRVTNVTNALGAFTYAYVDTTSRLAEVTYPNWQKTDYSYYNNVGDQRLKEIRNYVWGMFSNTPLSDFQYTYNPVGTIATWQQQTDASTPTQYALGYDPDDELTSAVQTNTSSNATVSSNGYNYDPAGNRLAETTLSGIAAGQFNNLNQLTQSGAGVATTFAGSVNEPVSLTARTCRKLGMTEF